MAEDSGFEAESRHRVGVDTVAGVLDSDLRSLELPAHLQHLPRTYEKQPKTCAGACTAAVCEAAGICRGELGLWCVGLGWARLGFQGSRVDRLLCLLRSGMQRTREFFAVRLGIIGFFSHMNHVS